MHVPEHVHMYTACLLYMQTLYLRHVGVHGNAGDGDGSDNSHSSAAAGPSTLLAREKQCVHDSQCSVRIVSYAQSESRP